MGASQILGPGMSGGMLEPENEDAGDLVASFDEGLYRDAECTIAAWCPFGSHACTATCPMAMTVWIEEGEPIFGCSFAINAAAAIGVEHDDVAEYVPQLYGRVNVE